MNMFVLVYTVTVLCFYYSRMHIANGMYHVHTHIHTNLRLQHYVLALQCQDKMSWAFEHSDPLLEAVLSWLGTLWAVRFWCFHSQSASHCCVYVALLLTPNCARLLIAATAVLAYSKKPSLVSQSKVAWLQYTWRNYGTCDSVNAQSHRCGKCTAILGPAGHVLCMWLAGN